jgi:hypothetical protein
VRPTKAWPAKLNGAHGRGVANEWARGTRGACDQSAGLPRYLSIRKYISSGTLKSHRYSGPPQRPQAAIAPLEGAKNVKLQATREASLAARGAFAFGTAVRALTRRGGVVGQRGCAATAVTPTQHSWVWLAGAHPRGPYERAPVLDRWW